LKAGKIRKRIEAYFAGRKNKTRIHDNRIKMIASESTSSIRSTTSKLAVETRISNTSYNGDDDSLRILIYTTCYNIIDGVTLTIRKIEQEILSLGAHVCIVTTKSGDINNTHMNGTHPNRRVIFLDNGLELPFLKDPKNPDMEYSLGLSLSETTKAAMDEFAPTLIHVTCPDCTALNVIEYARENELPLMGTYHSNIPDYFDHYPGMAWLKPILWGFFKQSYNFMQTLYVPTPYIKKNLIEQQQLDRLTKLDVWGRGVDLAKFSPVHRSLIFRQKLGIKDDVPVLLFVGRLVPEKRPDIFASVVQRLHDRGIAFHALVVGAGSEEGTVSNLPNTTVLGWLNGEKLSEAYASSDIFLFPSAVETFGNVTLEAAASGLPLVVESGCSGHLVKDDVNGFGCSAGDEDAFYQAALELCVNRFKRETFSEASIKLSETLEQRRVSRMMIDNYHKNTEEFYTTYSGHHGQRDHAYTKPGSFIAGTNPRPLGFGCIESTFLKGFRLLWNVYVFYLWCQDVIRLTFFLRRDQPSLVDFEDSSYGSCESESVTDMEGIDLFEAQVTDLEESLQKSKAVPVTTIVERTNSDRTEKNCAVRIGDSSCASSTCHNVFISVMLFVRLATAIQVCFMSKLRFLRIRNISWSDKRKTETLQSREINNCESVSRDLSNLGRRTNRKRVSGGVESV